MPRLDEPEAGQIWKDRMDPTRPLIGVLEVYEDRVLFQSNDRNRSARPEVMQVGAFTQRFRRERKARQ